jgi:hypothetical protein
MGWNCPGHYALIELPFPIPKFLCHEDWKKVIECICPICSHLIIDDVDQLLLYPTKERLNIVRNKIANLMKRQKEHEITCPHCNYKIVPYKVIGDNGLFVTTANYESTSFEGYINPIYIQNLLQNFTQYEELGFSEVYHPRDFMTNYIMILSTKLRPKALANAESTLTSYYKTIIEDCIPELQNLLQMIRPNTPIITPSSSKVIMFTKAYTKLYAYYAMITSPASEESKNNFLTIMNRKDRKHYDPNVSILGRFKGKDKSIFGHGITYSRVNRSARTVLGGAVDVPFRNISVPHHIAQALAYNYKVFNENLDAMRLFVASMANKDIYSDEHAPKVLQIIQNNGLKGSRTIKINPENAMTHALKLTAGDELVLTLSNQDFVIMSRFPIVREESATAFETKTTSNTIVSIPLPTCNMKAADFDGDETQTYCLTSHNTDGEAVLLQSAGSQFIAYKDGDPAIWYSADAPAGLIMVNDTNTIQLHNDVPLPEPRRIIDVLESFLPPDLCYVDSKTEIINGKFQNGKWEINNKNLHKYIYFMYGSDAVVDLMHNVTTLSYNISKEYGLTLGFDIRIFGDKKNREEIERIKNDTFKTMSVLERSTDPLKSFKIMQQIELQKPKILDILIPAAKGTNIDKMGWLKSRQDEYYQNVVQLDHVVVDGDRIAEELCDGTRTTINSPRFSINPCDYGLSMKSYDSDIDPTTHFYECKQQRLAIYQKGMGVATQGYLTKRLTVAFSKAYTDFNGAIVDNYRIMAPMYGVAGLNPRLYVEIALPDFELDSKSFAKKYSDRRLQFIHKELHSVHDKYAQMTLFTRAAIIKKKFCAGFDFDMFINLHKQSDKPTQQKIIDAFIEKIFKYFASDANKHLVELNFYQHEYYFRAKLAQCTLDDESMNKLAEYFCWTLQDGGEPVGGKAAIACSEPLTQEALHSIHHAGGGGVDVERIVRSTGTKRFEELLSTPKTKGTPSVMTIKLYDDSKENCMNFVCMHETFILNDLWRECYMECSDILPEFLYANHPNVDFKSLSLSRYKIILTIDMTSVADFNISVADIIYSLSSKINGINFISGYAVNDTVFMMYMFFNDVMQYDYIKSVELKITQAKPLVIHGSCIKNCFVYENANCPGHYLIECNDIPETEAYNTIMKLPEVDPTGCRYNDMRVCMQLFGVCETNARHCEELVYTALTLSSTSGILQRHYKVLADVIYAGGDAVYADRNNFKHDKYTDTLRYVQFETAKDMIKSAIKRGDVNATSDAFAAVVFNESANIGSTASKYYIFQK